MNSPLPSLLTIAAVFTLAIAWLTAQTTSESQVTNQIGSWESAHNATAKTGSTEHSQTSNEEISQDADARGQPVLNSADE